MRALHPNYFIRVFKRHFGTSPIQYVNRKRIEEAKRLLASTNFLLAEIETIVGIPNVFYLSKLFKSSTGLSPTAYRLLIIPVKVEGFFLQSSLFGILPQLSFCMYGNPDTSRGLCFQAF